LLNDLTRHFDHFKVPEELRGFAAQLVSGTLQKVGELDPIIEASTSNWKMNRLAPVDRSLLRMATYEMRSIPETPASVVINEAVELAKQFGNEETPSFINGILDSIRKATSTS
jgi:N utilization substance protein B